ncbi:hypothetical protein F4678DRAFT_468112 [Xylaria arbuscula]|nr:hypothetical protein F4678DRAFT_468112 [Xylaria arbuscula]
MQIEPKQLYTKTYDNAFFQHQTYLGPKWYSGHFAQRRRRHNPPLSLPVTRRQRPRNKSQVIVQFFHCEDHNIGEETLISPDVRLLVSAAVAFLGECQISDTPQTLLPYSSNAGYRGLSLVAELGGYHLHYPDHAGARPFNSDIETDWNRIMRIHAENSPDTILLVGVGAAELGTKCCWEFFP